MKKSNLFFIFTKWTKYIVKVNMSEMKKCNLYNSENKACINLV